MWIITSLRVVNNNMNDVWFCSEINFDLCFQSNQRDYQCSMCGKQFLRSISLKTHMKYHLNLKTKQCPHCPMVFVETKNLNRHLKTHVSFSAIQSMSVFLISMTMTMTNFVCFSNLQTLEKPYSCSICGRRFANSYNVR